MRPPLIERSLLSSRRLLYSGLFLLKEVVVLEGLLLLYEPTKWALRVEGAAIISVPSSIGCGYYIAACGCFIVATTYR